MRIPSGIRKFSKPTEVEDGLFRVVCSRSSISRERDCGDGNGGKCDCPAIALSISVRPAGSRELIKKTKSHPRAGHRDESEKPKKSAERWVTLRFDALEKNGGERQLRIHSVNRSLGSSSVNLNKKLLFVKKKARTAT